jgi:hypothetical protein
MSVIKRGKFYEYDFWYQKQRYTGTTLFETTGKNRDRNRVLAAEREAEVRRNVAHGVVDTFNLKTLPFVEAAELFLSHCKTNAEEVSSLQTDSGELQQLEELFQEEASIGDHPKRHAGVQGMAAHSTPEERPTCKAHHNPS